MHNLQIPYLNTTQTGNMPVVFKYKYTLTFPGDIQKIVHLISQPSYVKEFGPEVWWSYPHSASSLEKVT